MPQNYLDVKATHSGNMDCVSCSDFVEPLTLSFELKKLLKVSLSSLKMRQVRLSEGTTGVQTLCNTPVMNICHAD